MRAREHSLKLKFSGIVKWQEETFHTKQKLPYGVLIIEYHYSKRYRQVQKC